MAEGQVWVMLEKLIGSRCTGECGSQVMQRGRGKTQRTPAGERETTADSRSSEQTCNRL